MVNENISFREKELENCAFLVDEETDKFMHWMRSLDVNAALVQFREHVHQIRQAELNRTFNKLTNLNERDRREVEYLTERIVNKILNEPMQVLKDEASHGSGYKYVEALKALFGLKEEK